MTFPVGPFENLVALRFGQVDAAQEGSGGAADIHRAAAPCSMLGPGGGSIACAECAAARSMVAVSRILSLRKNQNFIV
jgi:hypothetical protein